MMKLMKVLMLVMVMMTWTNWKRKNSYQQTGVHCPPLATHLPLIPICLTDCMQSSSKVVLMMMILCNPHWWWWWWWQLVMVILVNCHLPYWWHPQYDEWVWCTLRLQNTADPPRCRPMPSKDRKNCQVSFENDSQFNTFIVNVFLARVCSWYSP